MFAESRGGSQCGSSSGGDARALGYSRPVFGLHRDLQVAPFAITTGWLFLYNCGRCRRLAEGDVLRNKGKRSEKVQVVVCFHRSSFLRQPPAFANSVLLSLCPSLSFFPSEIVFRVIGAASPLEPCQDTVPSACVGYGHQHVVFHW